MDLFRKTTLFIVLSWSALLQPADVSGQQLVIDEFPYQESFENGSGGWINQTITGNNNSWELGTPSGPVILGASDGENAWTTNLDGNYFSVENSTVISPVFDFSSLSQVQLSTDMGLSA